MIYLLNTPVLTAYGDYCFRGPITVQDARERIGKDFISAIGHDASAVFLSRLLGIDVPMNRISVAMLQGDSALVLRVKERLPEGKILEKNQLISTPYELAWLKRL